MTPAQRRFQCKQAAENCILANDMYKDNWITEEEYMTVYAIAARVRATVLRDIEKQRIKFINTKKYY